MRPASEFHSSGFVPFSRRFVTRGWHFHEVGVCQRHTRLFHRFGQPVDPALSNDVQ